MGQAAELGGLAAQQVVDVGTATLSVSTQLGMALPERHGHYVPAHSRIEKGGSHRRSSSGRYLNEITLDNPVFRSRRGMDFHPRTPCDLGNRVGQLLQPWPACPPAVKENRRWIGNECQIARPRLLDAGPWDEAQLAYVAVQPRRPTRLRLIDTTRLEGSGPKIVERHPATTELVLTRAPHVLEVILIYLRGKSACHAPAHLARHGQQYIAGLTGVEHRLHDRLLQEIRPRARLEIIPLLQRIVIGKYQVCLRGRLVDHAREAHLEANLAQRLDETQPGRSAVCRICAVDEEHIYGAVTHALREVGQTAIGRAGRRIGVRTERHRAPDVSGDVVQDVDGCRRCMRLIVLVAHAAGNGKTRPLGELRRQPSDRLRRHSTHTRRTFRIVPAQQLAHTKHIRRCIVTVVGQNHVGDRQCQDSLGTRIGGNPFVGVDAAHAHARLDVDVAAHPVFAQAVSRRKLPGVLNGIHPRLEEVRPEGQDVACLRKPIRWQRVYAEHLLVGVSQRLIAKRLEHQPALRAEGRQPLVDQPIEGA